MKITWLGHACFLLESGGYRIVIDPCKGVPGVPNTACEADAVYCSHDHFDHAFTRRIRLTEGKESPFTVREIPVFHDDEGGALRGTNTVRTFTADGVTVAHMGDLGHTLTPEQLAALGKVDVMLLPVGGTYTVDNHGAKVVVDAAAPRLTIPMHYRGDEIGFDVLQTAEEFTALFPAEDVHLGESNPLVVTESLLERGGVVVMTL